LDQIIPKIQTPAQVEYKKDTSAPGIDISGKECKESFMKDIEISLVEKKLIIFKNVFFYNLDKLQRREMVHTKRGRIPICPAGKDFGKRSS